MGQTGADFGAVPTAGLVNRIHRIAEQKKGEIDRAPLLTRGQRLRRKTAIDELVRTVDEMWEGVQLGAIPEKVFRMTLLELVAVELAGGERRPRFKF